MPHYSAIVNNDRALELPQEARQFVQPGQVIEIDLPEHLVPIAPKPNYAMLAALGEIAERQQGRPQSDGSQTLRLLREGRAGGSYGYAPTE